MYRYQDLIDQLDIALELNERVQDERSFMREKIATAQRALSLAIRHVMRGAAACEPAAVAITPYIEVSTAALDAAMNTSSVQKMGAGDVKEV